MNSIFSKILYVATKIKQKSDADFDKYAETIDQVVKIEFPDLNSELYSLFERRGSHYLANYIDFLRFQTGMTASPTEYDDNELFEALCEPYTDSQGVKHEFSDSEPALKLIGYLILTYLLQMDRLCLEDLLQIEWAYVEDSGKSGFKSNKEYVDYIFSLLERHSTMMTNFIRAASTTVN